MKMHNGDERYRRARPREPVSRNHFIVTNYSCFKAEHCIRCCHCHGICVVASLGMIVLFTETFGPTIGHSVTRVHLAVPGQNRSSRQAQLWYMGPVSLISKDQERQWDENRSLYYNRKDPLSPYARSKAILKDFMNWTFGTCITALIG